MCGVGYEMDSLVDRLATTAKSAAKHEKRIRRRNEAALLGCLDDASSDKLDDQNEAQSAEDTDDGDI